MAVFDTYRDKPAVRAVSPLAANLPDAVALKLVTADSERIVLYNPDSEKALSVDYGKERIEFHGHYAILRFKGGRLIGASLLGARELRSAGRVSRFRLRTICVCAESRTESSPARRPRICSTRPLAESRSTPRTRAWRCRSARARRAIR